MRRLFLFTVCFIYGLSDMTMTSLILLFVVPWLIILAATSDIFTMTIPNRLVIALIALFFLTGLLLEPLPLETIVWHMAAFISVLGGCFILFSLGVMGGGDAKLAAAIALWVGWSHTFEFLFIAALCGGLLTLGFVIVREMVQLSEWIKWPFLKRLMSKDKGIPYGVALSLSGIWIFSESFWLANLSLL
jgi:prepilin peptidase CpaA